MNFLYRVDDSELKKYLLEQGQRYELKAIDIVTHKKMWVFINTDKLQELIKLWEGKSPKNGEFGRYNYEKDCNKYRRMQ